MTSKWSLLGQTLGSVVAISSFIKYYFLTPDLDRVFFYGAIGCLICAVAYLYDRSIKHDNELFAIGEYLQENKGG